MNAQIINGQLAAGLNTMEQLLSAHASVLYPTDAFGAQVPKHQASRPIALNPSANQEPLVQASMSQIEMTIWLSIMAILGSGMLALLAVVSN